MQIRQDVLNIPVFLFCSIHGVLKAIMSGMMAGHLIVQSVNHDTDLLIETYSQWLTNWFKHDLTAFNKMYQNHPYPPKSWLVDIDTGINQ